MRKIFSIVLLGLIFVGVHSSFSVARDTENPMKLKGGGYVNEPQKVRAPEFAEGIDWLNTDKPLKLSGLRGKMVLLDFWTYGCINCIHIIPDLKKLEEIYGNELVVIGVHSAKFTNEAETENIRRVIVRYEIEHPVANDANFKIWDSHAVRAYPTQVLIDPDGYIVGKFVGEGNFTEIKTAIEETREEFSKRGRIDRSPLKFALEKAKTGDLPLSFPGKVLADPVGSRLFIADSGHNRIIETDFEGNLHAIIGKGDAGLRDGSFEDSAFRSPQGMAIKGDNLFVADTENHSIRKVDLRNKTVATIAGTGTLEGFNGFGGKPRSTALRSPWDLEIDGEELYIAMAGSHQIWRMDIEATQIAPFAGTRWEARTDGDIKAAAFAQPSGLVSDGRRLFIADSESNIIREIDLLRGEVITLVGGDLFVFGDEDGIANNVRLQHPLGIDLYEGKILVADTYNHKIKLLDAGERSVKTLLGNGTKGQQDGQVPTFYEPGGISVFNNSLYIADTNNHAIRLANLENGNVQTLEIKGLTAPKASLKSSLFENTEISPNLVEINLPPQIIKQGKTTFVLELQMPAGFHLNKDAPQRYEVKFEGDTPKISGKFSSLPLRISFENSSAISKATVTANVVYCRLDNTGVCYIRTLRWNVPFEILNGGRERIELRAELTLD